MKRSDAIKGLCAILDADGVGEWRPAGPAYTAAETAIHYGAIRSEPDKGIGVTWYGGDPTQDYDGTANGMLVQVRVRGDVDDPDSTDDIAEDVDAVLHRMTRRSGLSSEWVSGPLHSGADGNRRTEKTLNYRITTED